MPDTQDRLGADLVKQPDSHHRRTALITGASSDIGAAIATALASSAAGVQTLLLHCHSRPDNLQLLKDRLEHQDHHLRVVVLCADLRDPLQLEQMMKQIHDAYGTMDLLVYNAGLALQKLLTDTTLADWEQLFSVNITAAFLCSKAVLPGMIAQKSGKIITIASMWGITGASCEVAYSASKAAMIGFTKALAKEVAPSGITVNAVAPGVINTRMTEQLGRETTSLLQEEIPLGRIGLPEEVAHAVAFLASPQADYITGEILSVNGGMVI